MENDKQREWKIDLAEMLAQNGSVRTYKSDRHESPQVVTGTLKFREAFSNNLRRVYRVLVPWVEALLDKTRKEVTDNIIDSIRKLPLVVVGDSEATKQQIVEDIKDEYLKD